jgi:hypothetical protein
MPSVRFQEDLPQGQPMKDLRYLELRDTFLKYAYLAVGEHFSSHDDFINYFNGIKTDERKNLFLRTASFYLFLVKCGDWVVNMPGSDKVIDYLTNTHKYVAIFSLIESLSEKKSIDFYTFLIRKKSQIKFPIVDKNKLSEYYSRYKDEFGSIRRCISFFRTLSPEKQRDLISRLEVEGTDPTIERLAKFLYDMRSRVVHEAELALHMSAEMSIGYQGKKTIVCNLSIQDAMRFFEEGLIAYFQTAKKITTKST